MKKIILIVMIVFIIAAVAIVSYFRFTLPNLRNAPQLTAANSPENIKNGAYLANHVAVCTDCHSTRDWSRFSGPIVPGTEGRGGEYFGQEMGFPGTFFSKNITPYHLSDWTDGEIFRTITTGVDKNGKSLFPVMPYSYYGKMDKNDILDIIAYLRTLQPITYKPPARMVNFPMNFILNTLPKEAELVQKPDRSDTLKYGAYLVNAAGCIECHTKVNKGQIIKELAFQGGRDFIFPTGILYSANITPDEATGIGSWTVEDFIVRFKSYSDSINTPRLREGQVNTTMPWSMYAGMDSSDLRSIFLYLKTLPAVSNNVVHFVPKNG